MILSTAFLLAHLAQAAEKPGRDENGQPVKKLPDTTLLTSPPKKLNAQEFPTPKPSIKSK